MTIETCFVVMWLCIAFLVVAVFRLSWLVMDAQTKIDEAEHRLEERK
jgi:hypothetical protein